MIITTPLLPYIITCNERKRNHLIPKNQMSHSTEREPFLSVKVTVLQDYVRFLLKTRQNELVEPTMMLNLDIIHTVFHGMLSFAN